MKCLAENQIQCELNMRERKIEAYCTLKTSTIKKNIHFRHYRMDSVILETGEVKFGCRHTKQEESKYSV